MLGSIGFVGFDFSHALNDPHTGINATENGVFSIEPGRGFERNEELGSVGIGTGIGTGNNSRSGVF
jgi:hypothetical protein